MMKKPMIALIPLVDQERGRWWMNPDYMHSVTRAGGIAVMLPLTDREADLEQIAESFDGFIFTGGVDLDPVLYGQEKLDCCGDICPQRDAMELKLFRMVYQLDKPILGICRGIQLMNVALGGTLYQDIPTQIPSELPHRVSERPFDREVHEITVSPELPFGALPLTLGVNSRHHQCIQDLAPGLKIRATASDGVIEAMYMPGKRHVRGVLWHPENFDNDLSGVIFKDFVEAAR